MKERQRPSPIDHEAMMQLRESWAVRLEDGIEHAESGGWGLSVEDYQSVLDSLARTQTPVTAAPVTGSSRNGARIEQALRVPADLPVDWAHLRWYILEKARQPYNVAQLMQVRTLMNNWQSVLTAIGDSIDTAQDDLEGVIKTMTMQRRASLAVSGRMTWGFLSTMVPPPVGVALGAIVLWTVDDKHSDGIMKMLEWWLQMPFLFDRDNGQVVAPTYHNRYNNPNVQNRFPLAYNPGGQQSMKDTKDFNQMLKGIEKLYSGEKRKKIDKWDKKTIKFVIARLKDLDRGRSTTLKASFEAAVELLTEELQRALHEVLAEYEGLERTRRLLNALFALKREDIMPYAHRPDVVTHMMQELIAYFFNRLVHDKLVELRDQARVVPPAITGEFRTNMTKWAQMALLAGYFTENTTPLPDPTEIAGAGAAAQDELELNARGRRVVLYALFKSNMIVPRLSSYFGNPMEEKLTELGIVYKVAGANDRAPAPSRWLTRGPVAPMDIEAQPWAPGVLPIPYTDIGSRVTRCRLAAWARDSVARQEEPHRYTNAFASDGMLRAAPRDGHE